MKLTDLSATSGYMSFLFKAPPGFGKTIAAASFAKLGPVWLAYWDKKQPIELINFFKKHCPEVLHNIEYDVYGASNANEYLNKLFKIQRDCRYVACINDSVTNMTAGAVNWSLGFRDAGKKDKGKDRIVPDWDEYKVETSLVTQALDIVTNLPCHIIWTAHPVPGVKVEGSGAGIKVTKVNPIVSYGSKVAGILPGRFSEIYQFSKRSEWDAVAGKSKVQYFVSTEQVGDEYAKSNIGLNCEMDITDKLFYDVWKEEVKKLEVSLSDVKLPQPNPFQIPDAKTDVKTEPKRPWEK